MAFTITCIVEQLTVEHSMYLLIFSSIFLVFSVGNTHTQSTCSAVSSIKYGVIWPSSDGCTTSEPPCINGKKEIEKRCCLNGFWAEEPDCVSIQQEPSPCPDHFLFHNLYQICYIITEKKAYLPECPFKEPEPFNEYKEIIDSAQNLGPVWMPITRDNSDGLGFLIWMEASDHYKTQYQDNYYGGEKILGKNCLIYYNTTYIVAVNCQENYSRFCGYKPLNSLTNSYCTQKSETLCKQSDFTPDSKCFCLGSSVWESKLPLGTSLVQFIKPYQNYVYQSLTSDPCLNGIIKVGDKYLWESSRTEINYTNWSGNAIFGADHIYGVSTLQGWTLMTNQLTVCYLYETTIVPATPSIELRYQSDSHSLIVKIVHPEDLKWLDYNSGTLIYCFTDASAYNLIYRYPYLTQQESDHLEYVFTPHAKGPGHYWCEAFSYPDLDLIESNRIFLRQTDRFGPEFVIVLSVNYVKGTDPLNSGVIEFLERILFIRFKEFELLDPYNSRIFKIIDVDEEVNRIKVNVHLTAKVITLNLVQEYDQVNHLVMLALSDITGIDIAIEGFLSADYCLNDTTTSLNGDLLHWPITEINQKTLPNEFCFTSKGRRLYRKCVGNFVDGARWDELKQQCSIPKKSVVTHELLELLKANGSNNEVVENVTIISRRHLEFEPFDVYLMSEIMEKLQGYSQFNLDLLTEIMSNLHRIDGQTLLTSQLEMNSTDRLLGYLDELLIISNVLENSTEYLGVNDHFFIILINVSQSNVTGLSLDSSNNITLFYETVDVEGLDPNYDLVLLLDDAIREGRVLVTLFTTDALFNENGSDSRVVSKVMGLLLPDQLSLVAPITIYYNINESDYQENCAFWFYGSNKQGYWYNESEPIQKNSYKRCDYWHTTHFALVLIEDASLIDNLDPNDFLDLITTINCSLSLFGVFGIFLTGLLFKKWRCNVGNQILIHFSLSITLQIVTMYISGNIAQNDYDEVFVCTFMGCLLHYAILSQFCWMFVIAILQFKRFVEVLTKPPRYILLKACICGWVLPLIPVILTLSLDRNNYTMSHASLCYPSGFGLYLGVWLPLAVILLINTVIFVYIIYNVAHRKADCIDVKNSEILFQWRLAILLFFMLGLTWGFGLLAQWYAVNMILIYLFCCTATLQGFILFIFFIVCNRNTRFLYFRAVKVCCGRNRW